MRLIGTAASGLRAQQAALDTVGNNIANIDTEGFKASQPEFAEALTNARRVEWTEFNGQSVGGALDIGAGVIVSGMRTNFLPGKLIPTDNPMDLAIEGDGFFQVQGADGETLYTRAGTFRPDAAGNLVNASGQYLNPPLSLEGATDITVTPQGLVKGMRDGEEEVLGQILLADFPNREGLLKEGGNLYRATEQAGEPTVAEPGSAGLGTLRSSTLESSNVDLASSMTDLIQIQRAYQMNSRLVQDGDQMWSMANQLRR